MDLLYDVFVRSGYLETYREDLIASFCCEKYAKEFCKDFTKHRGDDVSRVLIRKRDKDV